MAKRKPKDMSEFFTDPEFSEEAGFMKGAFDFLRSEEKKKEEEENAKKKEKKSQFRLPFFPSSGDDE